MNISSVKQVICVSLIFFLMIAGIAPSGTTEGKSQARRQTSKKKKSSPKPSRKNSRSSSKSKKRSSKTVAKSAKAAPCQQKGYVNPAISKKYNAAIRDLRRAGIKPVITSTWRSSSYQAKLHNCSRSKKCRRRHPGLYAAMPPGRSLHEAGFAVDISGVAAGPRGSKRLTSRGRRIVEIMRKNGFKWPYGLADPAHFEADPRKYGYRSVSQAIHRSQSVCRPKVASPKKAPSKKASSKRKATSSNKSPQKRKTSASKKRGGG